MPIQPLYIDTLTESELKRLEMRLRPGESSEAGFLSPDESLRTAIERDRKTLTELGLTYDRFATALDDIMAGKRANLEVKAITYRGMQECPFDNKWTPHSGADYTVTTPAGEQLTFPGLISHLIREHQFFEGNTKYRVDPRKAARILGL